MNRWKSYARIVLLTGVAMGGLAGARWASGPGDEMILLADVRPDPLLVGSVRKGGTDRLRKAPSAFAGGDFGMPPPAPESVARGFEPRAAAATVRPGARSGAEPGVMRSVPVASGRHTTPSGTVPSAKPKPRQAESGRPPRPG